MRSWCDTIGACESTLRGRGAHRVAASLPRLDALASMCGFAGRRPVNRKSALVSASTTSGSGAALLAPIICTALLSSLLLLVGCSRHGGTDAVGEAGEISLGAAELREIVAALPETERRALAQDPAALERIVRAELLRRTILEDARAAGFDKEAATQPQLERARDDALVRLWVKRQGAVAEDYPTEQDLQAAFAANSAAFTAPAQYRVAQIFVALPNGADSARMLAALRKAETVAARLPNEDFSALARELSEHAPSAATGGDVGMLPADRMLPEIVVAVRELEPGGTAGPVRTAQGLHFVRLLERKPGAALTFDAAREQLVAALRARRAQELEQAYLARLDSRTPAAVDEIALAKLREALVE